MKYAPTVAKFGLKVIFAVQSFATRVVKYPAVGLPTSKVLKQESKGFNKASNAIHAYLSPQLQKGSEIFDDIRHPFGESFVQPMVSWRLT